MAKSKVAETEIVESKVAETAVIAPDNVPYPKKHPLPEKKVKSELFLEKEIFNSDEKVAIARLLEKGKTMLEAKGIVLELRNRKPKSKTMTNNIKKKPELFAEKEEFSNDEKSHISKLISNDKLTMAQAKEFVIKARAK